MRKLAIGIFLALPAIAYANVVWPALYLEMRLFSWWAITVGLVIEYLFVRKLFSVSPSKAAAATFTANLASALLGIILIPLAGFAWEIFPGIVFYKVFSLGTFNPITWVATFLLACAVNVVLEGLVYKRYLGLPFLFKSRLFIWFMLANTASVGVAMFSLIIDPVQP